VILLSVSGDTLNAYIVGRLNADQFPESLAEDDNPDLDRTEYADSAVIEYNPATGALNTTGIKQVHIAASVSVTLDTPKTVCTNLLQAKRLICDTAKIGDIEVTEHGHKNVQPCDDQSGSPV